MHITSRFGLTLLTLGALGLAAIHPAAADSPSSLYEQSRTVDSSVTVDLTSEGTIDWTKYSDNPSTSSPITYRKSGGTGITLSGVAGPQSYSDIGNNAPSFSWTNGNAPSQSGLDGSEYYYGTDGGSTTGSYTFVTTSLPGTTNFNVYTGAYNGGATITAELYDSNNVVIQTFSDAFTADAGQNLYKEYSFAYTGGDHLSTTVTSTNPYGNGFHTINLQAASLSTPEPSSVAAFALTGLGVLGSAFKARKRRVAA